MSGTHVNAPVPEDSSKTIKVYDNSRKLDFILRNGLAGGIAGCAAKTVVAPLDRVRILFQTSHSQFVQYSAHWNGLFKAARVIKTNYGISALFKGHSASLIRVFPYASLNFLAYEQFRMAIITAPEMETPFRRFLCGSMAGAISTLVTYPLELIRTRLAFETVQTNPLSWLDISRKIYFEGGGNGRLSHLYRGIAPTMLGILPYAGTSFLTHDQVRDLLLSSTFAPYTLEATSSTRLTAVAQLSCGAVAGIVAQTISYPIDVLRRRIQVASVVGTQSGILETIQRIYLERGLELSGAAVPLAPVLVVIAIAIHVHTV
ncbi:hypothetical protein ACN38_g716 [Penicillium nordicum]|uniref:Mitochondrial thiamine pyrophosphate carrier 1 n=1 Tax=Penicillium nordicum TaxID=229535 RepID=A0A0M9WKG2_9EURO|nr:hypothetical protein ACN38_g716 [Penicillium nordicum]